MSERCIVAVRFTGAGSASQVRKAVGGFLRYVQHRDLHPKEQAAIAAKPEVAGLLKYVAYRDQAAARAELFGPGGSLGSSERKAFAAFVLRSIEQSRPQLYRARSGEQLDRRRAVYRMVISPERAEGLDLRQLTTAAVSRLEREVGEGGLQWMAAIHRNTAHPHVHLVIAGMRETEGGFARVDLTKPRLAVIKQAVALEIQRQRDERVLALAIQRKPFIAQASGQASISRPPAAWRVVRISRAASWSKPALGRRRALSSSPTPTVLRLRAAAHRYRRQMERDAAEEARRRGWEHAA